MLFADFDSFVDFAAVSPAKDILDWKFVVADSYLAFTQKGFGDWKPFLGSAISEGWGLKAIKLAVILFGQISHYLFLLIPIRTDSIQFFHELLELPPRRESLQVSWTTKDQNLLDKMENQSESLRKSIC
jgi:hypothetical protein